MARHLLRYVKWEKLEEQHCREDKLYTYASSKIFRERGLEEGDSMWLVSVLPHSPSSWRGGEPYLRGRLIVDTLTRTAEQVVRLAGIDRNNVYKPDESMWYAIGRKGTIEPYCYISIEDITADLRFESSRDQLSRHQSLGQQCQTPRWLTFESAALLSSRRLAYQHTDDEGGNEQGERSIVEDAGYLEGARIDRLHQRPERNLRLVAEAKATFSRRHGGRLLCEVGGFDFTKAYGKHGEGFIEAHHKVAMKDLVSERWTRIADLAMVCANCHRMLHRRKPWLAVEELREIVQRRVA